jgi:hypothetical protein
VYVYAHRHRHIVTFIHTYIHAYMHAYRSRRLGHPWRCLAGCYRQPVVRATALATRRVAARYTHCPELPGKGKYPALLFLYKGCPERVNALFLCIFVLTAHSVLPLRQYKRHSCARAHAHGYTTHPQSHVVSVRERVAVSLLHLRRPS